MQSSNFPYIFIQTWFWLLPLPLPLFCLPVLHISTVLYYFHVFQLDITVEYLYLFSYITLRKYIKFFCGKVFFDHFGYCGNIPGISLGVGYRKELTQSTLCSGGTDGSKEDVRGAPSIAHSMCNLEASGFGLPRKLANARNLLVPCINFRKSNNGSLVCSLSPKPDVTSAFLLSPPMGVPKLALKPLSFPAQLE